MNKKFIIVIAIVLLVATALFMFTKSVGDGNGTLVSPVMRKMLSRPVPTSTPTPVPAPQVPAYNPPQEIHYNSATDLKQELETINPEVLESDFAE